MFSFLWYLLGLLVPQTTCYWSQIMLKAFCPLLQMLERDHSAQMRRNLFALENLATLLWVFIKYWAIFFVTTLAILKLLCKFQRLQPAK